MKTTTRLMIGVVAIAMVLSIAFSGVALADLYYYYQPPEVVGKMDYCPCLNLTDGTTNFIKDMDVDTGSVPNLNVMKSIGYGQGATIGSLSHDEEISMGIVAAPSPTEEVVLCPFASRATEGWWHEVDNNNEAVRLSVLPAYNQGNPAAYTLSSKLPHYGKSPADGLWEFHKDYPSVIRP